MKSRFLVGLRSYSGYKSKVYTPFANKTYKHFRGKTEKEITVTCLYKSAYPFSNAAYAKLMFKSNYHSAVFYLTAEAVVCKALTKQN